FRVGRTGPLHRAHLIRRSDDSSRCPGAGKYRDPHVGLLCTRRCCPALTLRLSCEVWPFPGPRFPSASQGPYTLGGDTIKDGGERNIYVTAPAVASFSLTGHRPARDD